MAAIGTRIDRIFKKAAEEAAKIGGSIKSPLPEDRIFSFDDFPATQKQIERLMTALQQSMEMTIVSGVRSAWTLSNNKNNALVSRIFGDRAKDLTKEQYRRYFSTNAPALEAFLQRKSQGLNLSDQVWRYTERFKNEIELALDLGIRTGESAAQMSRSLRQYLQHPDKLFRRVRDEHGLLRLSQAAQDFHPEQGVYRSSYKNARRLACTETNIAYRTADHLRWQQMDFVVGIEVKLSNNHTLNGVPLTDICDTLKGRYPKDFKFTGWHPHCRCRAIPILKTEQEMAADTQRILAGEEPEKGSVNTVRDVPKSFSDWVEDNSGRIERAAERGTMPYFIKDNQGVVDKILGMSDNPTFATKVKVGEKEYLLKDLIAECRGEPTENGKIYVHPDHGKNELTENLDFARWRAEGFGEEVVLLPNPNNAKSADSYNITRGVNEEYKRSHTPTKNSIDKRLKDAAKQADYIILEPDDKTPVGVLESGIKGRLTQSAGVKELRVKIGNAEAVYTREQILSNNFKIKPEDFHNVSVSRSEAEGSKEQSTDAKLRQFFGLNKKTPQEIAAERHAVRDAAAIQQRWNERRIANVRKAIADGLLPQGCDKGLAALSPEHFKARIDSLQKTAKRHAARTPDNIQSIKKAWEQKLLRDKHTRLMADNVLKLRSEYPHDVDFSVLEKIIADNNLTKMREEAKRVAQAIQAVRNEEKALTDLIPDAHGWHKQFSLVELRSVHSNVERTIKAKGWFFDIDNTAELGRLKSGLEHEIHWMETKGRKYKTWEVSRSVYHQKLTWADKRIEMLNQKKAIETEIDIIRKSRSKVGKQLVADFDAMFKSDATDLAALRAKAADIKAKADQIEKTRNKKASSTISTASTPFGGMTDEEAKKALVDFAKRIGTAIDHSKVVVDNGFIHLQGDQHMYLYEALKAETPAEHRQLWNHSGGGGAHFGKGGYVRTGNSFQINSAFRKNGIFGDIDATNEALLRKAGMTTDDLKTIKLLDKKIAEFSMPVPILATRYVDLDALTNIFGQPVKGRGRGTTTSTLESWKKAVEKLPTKNMQVDPAFLSASLNETQNVFYGNYKVKLQIEIPPGTPMYMTDNYPESEVVLGRGTQLEFIGVSIQTITRNFGVAGDVLYHHVTIRCRVKR